MDRIPGIALSFLLWIFNDLFILDHHEYKIKMSFILVIGGALMPSQGYEQCEGGHPPPHPFSWRPKNTFQMNDEISQNKVLNIFLYIFFNFSIYLFHFTLTNSFWPKLLKELKIILYDRISLFWTETTILQWRWHILLKVLKNYRIKFREGSGQTHTPL